ncbi:MAG: tetratricopeptide repeat protein [Weeksellaceae bacterium]
MEKKELTANVIEKIDELAQQGNDLFDKNDFNQAIKVWEQALELIPEDKNLYAESQWLYTSIGDAYFYLKDFEKALETFNKAKANIENNAYGNPFIMLRLGQSYLENNLTNEGKEFLLRAYMIEGKEIFEDENEKYFNFLNENVDLNKA